MVREMALLIAIEQIEAYHMLMYKHLKQSESVSPGNEVGASSWLNTSDAAVKTIIETQRNARSVYFCIILVLLSAAEICREVRLLLKEMFSLSLSLSLTILIVPPPAPSPPLSLSLSHPVNVVQTSVLNLDPQCLTKHMECYCSRMLLT